MTEWNSLKPCLPPEWLAALERLTASQKQELQELRLRADQPVMVSTSRGVRYLCRDGLTSLRQPGIWVCTRAQLARCVALLCQESVYAHQEELRQGFISLAGGIRVGVAGRAVTQGEQIRSVQEITALCIRLPRRHAGCAADVLPYLEERGRLYSSVLVGEPASGKTSLLRDAAATLARRGYRVAVVDERGELGGVAALPGCDVLQGYPKAVGIRQAVRCLAPQVVVFDELGEEAEVQAVAACAHAGVAVVASLHGRDSRELARLPSVRLLAQRRIFEHWVFLTGRHMPGRVRQCLCPEVKEHEIHWTCVDRGGRGRSGAVRFPSLVSPGENIAAAGTPLGVSAAAADLFRTADGADLAAAGSR